MIKFRIAEAPEELFGSPVWEKLEKHQKQYLQFLMKPEKNKGNETTLIEILSMDGEDLFFPWYQFRTEVGSFGGVMFPEDFDPETMPEEVSEAMFEHIDELEQKWQETIEFSSHNAREEAFWQEVGLTEENCLCWMRAGGPEEKTANEENGLCDEKAIRNKVIDQNDGVQNVVAQKDMVTLRKVDLTDPQFVQAVSASFEEGKGLYLEQIRSLKKGDVPPEACLIMKEERIIGEALLCYSSGEYMLSYFGILPEVRGKGYGTMALMRILQEYFPLILSVDEDSDAYRLYERCGFEPYRYDITFVVGR